MTSPDAPNTKFDEAARSVYIDHLRKGNLKYESARLAGVSYRTVQRRREDDDEFKAEENHALAEAREGIEKVLYDMAKQGDISAIKMWMTAHDRSTYGDKKTIELDATPAASQMSADAALAAVAGLQLELESRRSRLLESGDVIEVSEVPQLAVVTVESHDDDDAGAI